MTERAFRPRFYWELDSDDRSSSAPDSRGEIALANHIIHGEMLVTVNEWFGGFATKKSPDLPWPGPKRRVDLDPYAWTVASVVAAAQHHGHAPETVLGFAEDKYFWVCDEAVLDAIGRMGAP